MLFVFAWQSEGAKKTWAVFVSVRKWTGIWRNLKLIVPVFNLVKIPLASLAPPPHAPPPSRVPAAKQYRCSCFQMQRGRLAAKIAGGVVELMMHIYLHRQKHNYIKTEINIICLNSPHLHSCVSETCLLLVNERCLICFQGVSPLRLSETHLPQMLLFQVPPIHETARRSQLKTDHRHLTQPDPSQS